MQATYTSPGSAGASYVTPQQGYQNYLGRLGSSGQLSSQLGGSYARGPNAYGQGSSVMQPQPYYGRYNALQNQTSPVTFHGPGVDYLGQQARAPVNQSPIDNYGTASYGTDATGARGMLGPSEMQQNGPALGSAEYRNARALGWNPLGPSSYQDFRNQNLRQFGWQY